ncbi:MAG: ATP-binding cassette domain-containing protein, partial [Bacteroidota bacterium]
MIEIHNLSKAFGKQQILEDVSLEIAAESILCLVGGSGSGKSVLTKLILGLESIDRGRILIEGNDTAHFTPKRWRGLLEAFGVVFQNAALLDSLTVWENIGIRLLEDRQLQKNDIRDRVAHCLKKVRLSPDIMGKLPAELSGGMRKRV